MDSADNFYSDDNATFGDRLVAAREAASMSQRELARRMGIKEKTLRGWEDDASEPRANKLQMLAGVLNVSIMWLLSGEGTGLGDPDQVDEMPAEVQDALVELRTLKVQMLHTADKLARIEKALRNSLREGA